MTAPQSGQIAEPAGSTDPAQAPGPAATTPAPPAASDGSNGKAATRDWERDAKKFQSECDQLKARYAPIEERMRQYGLDSVRAANSIDQLATLWTHPELGPVNREFFASGTVKLPTNGTPSAAPQAEDRYVDPDLVAMKEELAGKLAAIEQRLGAVSQTSQLSASAQVAQTLKSYETDFLARFPLTDEERSSFSQKMDERFQWMVKNQPQTLVQLQRETYEDLALPVVHRVADVLSLGERAAQKKQQGPTGRATDARLRAPTTGTETAPHAAAFDHTPTHNEIQSVARAAVEQLRREKGYTGSIR